MKLKCQFPGQSDSNGGVFFAGEKFSCVLTFSNGGSAQQAGDRKGRIGGKERGGGGNAVSATSGDRQYPPAPPTAGLGENIQVTTTTKFKAFPVIQASSSSSAAAAAAALLQSSGVDGAAAKSNPALNAGGGRRPNKPIPPLPPQQSTIATTSSAPALSSSTGNLLLYPDGNGPTPRPLAHRHTPPPLELLSEQDELSLTLTRLRLKESILEASSAAADSIENTQHQSLLSSQPSTTTTSSKKLPPTGLAIITQEPLKDHSSEDAVSRSRQLSRQRSVHKLPRSHSPQLLASDVLNQQLESAISSAISCGETTAGSTARPPDITTTTITPITNQSISSSLLHHQQQESSSSTSSSMFNMLRKSLSIQSIRSVVSTSVALFTGVESTPTTAATTGLIHEVEEGDIEMTHGGGGSSEKLNESLTDLYVDPSILNSSKLVSAAANNNHHHRPASPTSTARLSLHPAFDLMSETSEPYSASAISHENGGSTNYRYNRENRASRSSINSRMFSEPISAGVGGGAGAGYQSQSPSSSNFPVMENGMFRDSFETRSSIASASRQPSYHSSNVCKDLKSPLAHSVIGYEEVAWAFAQMTGYFTVDGSYVKAAQFEPLKLTLMYKSTGMSGGGTGGGGSFGFDGSGGKSAVDNKNFPLFSTAPTILFYDMKLAPGESRSYRYEIDLPSVLPPSHRGRVIRFTYKLIIGVHRTGGSMQSQIFQIPFRIFNRIDERGAWPVYEVMNPVIVNKDEAIVLEGTGADDHLSSIAASRKRQGFLVDGASASGTPIGSQSELYAGSCMTNIVMACQSARKVSYDICKNNEPVAKVILLRNTYRLGETITGIVNFSHSRIPCYQISAYLENSENIESVYSIRSKQQTTKQTRKIVAEQHRNVLNARRTNISLTIPLSGTPEFQTTAVHFQWCVRLEFITGIRENLMQATIMSGSTILKSENLVAGSHLMDEGANFVHYNSYSQADVDAFDCIIPLKVFGSDAAASNYAGGSIPKSLEFEIARETQGVK